MFNVVGSRIWELADGARTLGEIAAVLADEFEVDLLQAEESTQRFIAQLAERDLVVFNER